MKKIVLIDGNSLMFRSYYATAYTGNLMQNKSGLYTNAIYGFCNMLTKLLDKDVDSVFVAFDAGKQTFRHKEYNEYKGGRKPTPEEFKVQIPYIKKYLQILNIKQAEMLDYEADDLIASVARFASYDPQNDIQIITGDKDLLQMVDKNIRVFLTKKGITELEEYNEENFYEKVGFSPKQVADYKGLVGDSSDNLPGIKGVGEKTALKLLEQYHTLENIVESVDDIKGKLHDAITENKEIGLKCKRLAILKQDLDLDFTLKDLKFIEPNNEELIEFFKKLDFYSLLKKIDMSNDKPLSTSKENVLSYIIANDNYDFSSFEESYIIIEVFKENYLTNECIGLGIYTNNQKVYIPFNSLLNNKSLHTYLASQKVKRTFDYKKLYVVLKKNNIIINGIDFDGLLASYIINPACSNDDVKTCLEHFIATDLRYDDSVYGYKSKAVVPAVEDISKHCLQKARALMDSHEVLLNKMKEFGQMPLFQMELNLSPILGDMELNGLKIERSKLQEIEVDLNQKLDYIAKEIYKLAGEEFNINSVKKLGEILFEKMKLPSGKKNKTGFSTNSEVLEKLANHYDIARLILEYRTIAKIVSTYVNGLYDVMNEEDFVHPLYKQALTLTGRLSSVNPNIQNMPIRTEIGQVIREAFISRFPGGKIMGADYSQIELRVLAHMSNDEKMIEAFNSNIDFHSNTASWLYDVPVSNITKDMRRTAKAINFGIVYGMSAWGLSESIHISPNEATNYINKYFYNFSSVRNFLDESIAKAKELGYSETLFKRLRYIPELQNSNKNLVGFGERTAMNSPIQGTAADIIKMAMAEVNREIKDMKSILIAQVHDELLFDVYPGELEELQKRVKRAMEEVVNLKVAVIVECESGNNWLEA